MAKKKLSFEDALKQLEAIAEQIEQGKIGLEESITQYERAMGLVKHCREILTQAELKIQQLQQRADGTLEANRWSGWRKVERSGTATPLACPTGKKGPDFYHAWHIRRGWSQVRGRLSVSRDR